MRSVRAIGLACGLVASALAVHSWAIASTGSALGTDLGIAALAPGELKVASGLALHATGLQPASAPATGRLRVRNITGVPVRIRLRALPSTRALDGVLDLRASARGRQITINRSWTSTVIVLGVGRSLALPLRARLRRPAQGLIADVTLELDAIAVRRR